MILCGFFVVCIMVFLDKSQEVMAKPLCGRLWYLLMGFVGYG